MKKLYFVLLNFF